MTTFTLKPIEHASYIALPLELITNPAYRKLGLSCAVTYAYLLDRTSLSRVNTLNGNTWEDEQGLFILLKKTSLMELLGCAKQKVYSVLHKLVVCNP